MEEIFSVSEMLASNLRAISQVVLLRNICRSNSTVESDIDNNKKITKSIDKNLDETEKNRENKNDLKSQVIYYIKFKFKIITIKLRIRLNR